MFATAVDRILTAHGLTTEDVQRTLREIQSKGVDYADIYFQITESNGLSLEDSLVKEADFHVDHGLGVRAISGEKTGFAYSDDIDLEALRSCAKTASSIVHVGGEGRVALPQHLTPKSLYDAINPWHNANLSSLVEFLREVDRFARARDSKIRQVMVSLASQYDTIMIAASDGTYSADIRPLVRLNIRVVAEDEGHREIGFSGGGGRYSLQKLLENDVWKRHVEEAVRVACLNLKARPAPAGTMDVVLGNGWPGVLLHEAVGHGLEGDFNRKGLSAFSELMGQQVASELCTVVDDGTLLERRGSLSVDDEGIPTQCSVLIEKGRLKGYMQDKLNAKLMKVAPTGNGRRESYAHLPLPRMTNTYLLPGKHAPEEIIRSVKKGLYAVNFSGGQVDITSGKYVFVANEAYWIENGQVKYPVKGATLIGDGPTALKGIAMVGNDLALDEGVGICGKEGQSVPVGVGMPTVLVKDLTVGGTQ